MGGGLPANSSYMEPLPKTDDETNLDEVDLIRLEEKLCLLVRTNITDNSDYYFRPEMLDDVEQAVVDACREMRKNER